MSHEDSLMENVVSHFEILGYDVEAAQPFDTVAYVAEHDVKLDHIFQGNDEDGIYFLRSINVTFNVPRDRVLHALNAFNEGTFVTRYSLNEEDELSVQAWWPPVYDRNAFNRFLEIYQD